MNPISNSSGQSPVYPQAGSLNTASSDGGRVAEQQESLSRLTITDDQPGADCTPGPVSITDRSVSIPAMPATYDYVCTVTNKTYRVVTEQFAYNDGSCGLRLNQVNGQKFITCSLPFSYYARFERTYTEPDFDEEKHLTTLMLIKDYPEDGECLAFLTKNNIVKVVGNVEFGTVDFPIVQLIENSTTQDRI